ncbi:hypothetical protein BKA66DRAFT_68511 [Pyrenochaeta sp. MPI-SDFR-AT-0127]|nr:hypothetical protein BKA66DRAFT_68511 [Pyrenochaeta sp. MPI-SDFR-AT-0127]
MARRNMATESRGFSLAMRYTTIVAFCGTFYAKIFQRGQGPHSGTDHTAQRDVYGRTHYLPSCLVERMAIAVLYLLQINHLGLAGFARLS